MCGFISDLVICKFRKSMVIHDTECPYWDQVSLNNTNQTKLKLTYHNVEILRFVVYSPRKSAKMEDVTLTFIFQIIPEISDKKEHFFAAIVSICTKILEVNLFACRLFHKDFSPIYGHYGALPTHIVSAYIQQYSIVHSHLPLLPSLSFTDREMPAQIHKWNMSPFTFILWV